MTDGAPLRFVPLGRCVLCESERTAEAFVGEDRLFGVPGRFGYRICTACATVFQDPQVAGEDIARLYPRAYYTHEPADEAAPAPRALAGPRDHWRGVLRDAARGGHGLLAVLASRSRSLRERAFFGLTDELIPREADQRALEVGPGSGGLLALLVRAGWPQVEGVDFDASAARVAEERSGRPVQVASFTGAELPASAFDLIVMVHVFEHLPDPQAVLARLRVLLRPAGRAVLIGPNPRSLGARLFGPFWVEWDPPRHLVLPPVSALRTAARGLGLRVARARTRTRVPEKFTWSRAARSGRPPGPAGWRDRLWSGLGSALAAAGAEVGEEMVVVLERSDQRYPLEKPLGVPAVSITVVVYNSDHTLPACLESVRPVVASGLAELIVVDNASPDRSAEVVARDFAEATLVRAPANGGFAAGSNLGWSRARGRYWLLLNPDVVVPPGGIEALVAWMDARPDLGAASPELVDADGRSGGSARRFPSIGRSLLELTRLQRLLPESTRARLFLGSYWQGPGDRLDADWVPATALLVRRDVVDAVGPLAGDLPLYGEDLEWCWRIRRAGFGIGVCGSLRFLHLESASARRTLGDDERDRRMAFGAWQADVRTRGAWHARALGLVNLAAFALESIHPFRPASQRAASRRHLAAQARLLAGWRPQRLPGSAEPPASGTPWS